MVTRSEVYVICTEFASDWMRLRVVPGRIAVPLGVPKIWPLWTHISDECVASVTNRSDRRVSLQIRLLLALLEVRGRWAAGSSISRRSVPSAGRAG